MSLLRMGSLSARLSDIKLELEDKNQSPEYLEELYREEFTIAMDLGGTYESLMLVLEEMESPEGVISLLPSRIKSQADNIIGAHNEFEFTRNDK